MPVKFGFYLSAGILVLTVTIAAIWSWRFPAALRDYYVEFVGLIFDVIFILVLLSLFEHRRRRAQDRKRQGEVIEDYKRWDSEEARVRLAGAIRRLNRLGISKLDLTGASLTDFEFSQQGIPDISGTTFYDGTWGDPLKQTEVRLTRVNFNWIRCRDVQFSAFDPLGGMFNRPSTFAKYADCTFMCADLTGASFNGAHLQWTDPPPGSLYDDEGFDDNGAPISIKVRYGAFDEADLTGTSFENVHFDNADFRGALNIADANFSGAKGLATCVFDAAALENDVLRKANVRTK